MLQKDCPGLREVLDGLREPILVIDTEFRVRLANQAALELSEDERTLDRYCYQLSHQRYEPCTGESHPCPLARVRETGSTVTVTHEHETAGGGRRYVELVASPLWTEDGEFAGIVESSRDVTERLRTQRLLEQTLRDKDLLMREMHHRVKNNLLVVQSLLQLQSRQLEDAQAREYFDESQQRLRSMGMIHERLYRSHDLSRVELGDYVRTLVDQLMTSYQVGGEAVRTVVDVPPIYLDVDTIIPCGLILNELVSNALKYAFPDGRAGILEISFEQVGPERYTLRVRDDGVGLPEDLDLATTRSLGLKIVTSLVRQLGATLEIERDGGAGFHITFDDPSAEKPDPQAPARRAG